MMPWGKTQTPAEYSVMGAPPVSSAAADASPKSVAMARVVMGAMEGKR
jgi:hypothetical protein